MTDSFEAEHQKALLSHLSRAAYAVITTCSVLLRYCIAEGEEVASAETFSN